MKKFWIFLLLIATLAIACFATCPDKEAHKKAVKECIDEAIRGSGDDQDDITKGFMSLLSGGISKLATEFVDIDYHNYYLISISKISSGDEYTYALGILNKVIIIGKDQIMQSAREAIGV